MAGYWLARRLHQLKASTSIHGPRYFNFPFFCMMMCVCVCVFSSHSFWTSSSLDVPAGVTQEEGHTGSLIHLLSAVRALIFLARRIQPSLSLVDCEVEFCAFSTRWAFLFCFLVFYSEKSLLTGSNSRPNVSEGTEVPLSYRGNLEKLGLVNQN